MNLINNLFKIKILAFSIFLSLNLILAQKINKNGKDDEITEKLPGQDFDLNFKHYSGYLQVSKTKFLHYVLTKSQNNPDKDPLVLWLNGGPGCSSLLGLFTELGPYLLLEDGSNKLIKNPYAWNNNANVLFLESPAGVGYSYSTDGNITTNDDETANYNYEALKQFLNKFPEYKGRPTIISGESYAGVYLPMLANLIIKRQKKFPINLKGVLIGNGMLSQILNTNTMPLYAYGHAIIDEELWQYFGKKCCKGCAETCDIVSYANKTKTECYNIIGSIFKSINNGISNPYDIYRDCDNMLTKSKTLTKNSLLGMFSRTPFILKTLGVFYLRYENKFENLKIQSEDERYDEPIIPCINGDIITKYMNLPKGFLVK
uniref:Carboxypeptidase n=1 Tax=Meloidogyne enterolobii TaxID=390850 RepID=A0A6V7V4T3_MELEN|nr:unnamed protein product [Meloidogyne enterolobii]